MKAIHLGLAALALALPATAQVQDAPDVELYAEMLAMSQACTEIDDMAVRGPALRDWISGQLATRPEEMTDQVVSLRDSKMAEIQATTRRLSAMERGRERSEAVDRHYAAVATRCRRMADDRLAGRWFTYRGM